MIIYIPTKTYELFPLERPQTIAPNIAWATPTTNKSSPKCLRNHIHIQGLSGKLEVEGKVDCKGKKRDNGWICYKSKKLHSEDGS